MTPPRREPRALALVFALGLSACRNEEAARKKLEADGYTDIALTSGSGQAYAFTARKNGQDCEGTIVATIAKTSITSTCKKPIAVCSPGEPDKCFDEAAAAENTDPSKAADLFRRACEAGSGNGCSNLAIKYMEGKGVEKDAAKALSLFKEACEKKSGLGCRNLGIAYERGVGTEKDEVAALAAYDSACAYDDPMGCFNLGVFAKHGRGAAVDMTKAADAFEKACKLRYEDGCAQAKLTPR